MLPICSQLMYKKSNLQHLRQLPPENPREIEKKVEHLSSGHEKKLSLSSNLFFRRPSQNGLSVLLRDHTYLRDDREVKGVALMYHEHRHTFFFQGFNFLFIYMSIFYFIYVILWVGLKSIF